MKNIFNKLLIILCRILIEKMKKIHLKQHKAPLPISIICGSVGKSTVTLMINQELENTGCQKVYSGTSLYKNYNTLTGLAMTLTGQKFSIEKVGNLKSAIIICKNLLKKILHLKSLEKSAINIEIGVDHQGEMDDYLQIFRQIDFCILTGATIEHAGGYSRTKNEQLLTKLRPFLPVPFFEQLKQQTDTSLVNSILENLKLIEISEAVILPKNVGRIENSIYIKTDKNALWQEKKCEAEYDKNGNLRIILKGGDSIKKIPNEKYFLPTTFARNYLILDQFQKNMSRFFSFKKEIQHIFPVSRFGKFLGKNNSTIIDSTYNSDPQSLQIFLEQIWQIAYINPNLKHTLVLGEMRELGENSTSFHREILQNLEENHNLVEKIFLIGNEWRKIDLENFGGIDKKIVVENSAKKVGDKIEKIGLNSLDWIWCKGSQNTIFCEECVKKLLQNPEDSRHLCRQSEEWQKTKNEFFQSI